ncbi:hypothetical protein NX722_23475 [Endozoicomonas gorgoniicola]|uniref:Uncharacterized protein n=1 Tax=Endozoicomonas gorgoniicola TaxID=1234144 RepID=A0ABT3N1L8_9GAMM|nr:hypothetical protein [Endozoicomonas gorgoniicola]MCW7555528.1 hypothetical protein [Endozoicomonas gorgoniicola]
MLSLRYNPGAMRIALNLFPLGDNRMETRPGARQLITGNINRAIGWGNRIAYEKYGYLFVQDAIETNLRPRTANLQMCGATFQSLIKYGDREERLYIGSGKDIFYLRRRTNTTENPTLYESVTITNEVKDADNNPYQLPQTRAIASWRNRLWAGDGTHTVYHTEHDKPHLWDPLNAIEFQSGTQNDVTALCPFGDSLIVATPSSLWAVTGDSKYNFQRDKIVNGNGAVNQRCITTDGQRLYYLDRNGVFELGQDEPLSGAIEDLFRAPDNDAELMLDPMGVFLYLLYDRHIYVYNTLKGGWGQLDVEAKGLIKAGDRMGWYGKTGLWLMGSRYAPDVLHDGSQQAVRSHLRTWPVQPNPYGMTSLNRSYISMLGVYQNTGSYSVYEDDEDTAIVSEPFDLYRKEPDFLQIGSHKLYKEKPQRVYDEIPVNTANEQFEHELVTEGYFQLISFEPSYTHQGS